MTERKRPIRRSRTSAAPSPDSGGDDNPYLDAPSAPAPRDAAPPPPTAGAPEEAPRPRRGRPPRRPAAEAAGDAPASVERDAPPTPPAPRAESRPEPREPRSEPRVELRPEPRSAPRPESLAPPSFFDPAAERPRLDSADRYDRAFDRPANPPASSASGASSASSAERPESRPDRPFGDRPERPDRPDRGGRQRDRGRHRHERGDRGPRGERPDVVGGAPAGGQAAPPDRPDRGSDRGPDRGPDRGGDRNSPDRGGDAAFRRNGRRGRNRFRRGGAAGEGRPPQGVDGGVERAPSVPSTPTVVEGTMSGWFDASRDGGFLRRAINSYLPDPTDPFVPPALVRLHQLRRGDKLDATFGRDPRGRQAIIEVQQLNDGSPVVLEKRSDFNTLTASYPDRKLTLETGRPAKTGPELTRRAIDLIAPIGYGQRALIVAPARAGKTTLLQAIVEGVAINHPESALLVLLVDERPEEVSEMITWGYGEVVASSFDMPPKRHVEVAEMTLERARRMVEQGKDVVIVLDSITRLARAYNTVERGTGRTMSGGLDSNAMQKPKAFFGSARMIAPQHGGGSLTIISTALVETGSRMDDVIFEEFKGTGNCEIKLDRSLADRRIFPAFDIGTSGTRREEKLYRPDQLEKVHLLRRGLHQLPPQAGMEWLIKRIAATTNNDSLLDGL
ncbi:transcription termination factor Rho [Gemmatimonas sp.]|uniref:transcription termination factor Rho n=1 Tax=Gemmatimonas sp. TaxID=1962908 RepID=UPI00286E3C22|nr:transcription termination factor Rho [Gemmatimonas sp.]